MGRDYKRREKVTSQVQDTKQRSYTSGREEGRKEGKRGRNKGYQPKMEKKDRRTKKGDLDEYKFYINLQSK